jgi:ADP-dependent NAD(P)H-hydrate dehydratase / NAD(P)H-hydrate epimerase
MLPVLTVAEMGEVDARARKTTPLEVLVGRAGRAAALAAADLLGGTYGRRVTVVAGRGNNGADGRVAAALLGRRGARVTIVEAGTDDDLGAPDLVIDAAYGTGFHGEYRAPAVAAGARVLAVDIPSGVRGDTGEASGSPLAADRTVTFAALKPGLLQWDGAHLAGEVRVADIGLEVGTASAGVVEDADVAALVPPRRSGGNKWSAAVLVVAGSPGMTGAAALSARAAYRSGAGMVRLGVPGATLGSVAVDEAVGVDLTGEGWSTAALEAASRCGAMVLGPGLGRTPATAGEVRRLAAESPVPVVLDADGLFAIDRIDRGELAVGKAPLVLTPHDGEYARLMGSAPGPDRIDAARRLASAGGSVGLLKGSTTTVADAAGEVLVNTTGSVRLATAGTGDVLSGIIGAFLARGVEPRWAAALAAHVHGRAAWRGPSEGLVAGDLPELVAAVLSELVPPAREEEEGIANE